MIDRRIFFHINWSLLLFTLILAGIGIINLYSASALRLEDGVSLTPYYAELNKMGLFLNRLMMLLDKLETHKNKFKNLLKGHIPSAVALDVSRG